MITSSGRYPPLRSRIRKNSGPSVLRQPDFSRSQLRDFSIASRYSDAMPKYIIEREIPGAGKLTPDELRGISQTSCGVLRKLGPQIQWVESYVTADKVYCVYLAPGRDLIDEHARQGGFPANKISEVMTVIDPTTAES